MASSGEERGTLARWWLVEGSYRWMASREEEGTKRPLIKFLIVGTAALAVGRWSHGAEWDVDFWRRGLVRWRIEDVMVFDF